MFWCDVVTKCKSGRPCRAWTLCTQTERHFIWAKLNYQFEKFYLRNIGSHTLCMAFYLLQCHQTVPNFESIFNDIFSSHLSGINIFQMLLGVVDYTSMHTSWLSFHWSSLTWSFWAVFICIWSTWYILLWIEYNYKYRLHDWTNKLLGKQQQQPQRISQQ